MTGNVGVNLVGKVGFSSYEEVGHIFPKSYIIKNDNSDVVIIDGVSCENVISLNMVDKFQLEEKDYTHRYNQSLHSKEKHVNVSQRYCLFHLCWQVILNL